MVVVVEWGGFCSLFDEKGSGGRKGRKAVVQEFLYFDRVGEYAIAKKIHEP